MKHLLLLSAFLIASTASARPMAFLKQSGGLCRGECPQTSLTVEDDGTVMAELQKFVPSPSVERRILLRMGRDFLNTMKRDINSIQAAELVDLDEDQPICQDIPEQLYTVVQNDRKIDIGIDRDCHKHRLKNNQGTQLVEMLQKFMDIENYTAH